jgi:hypothetical protein
MTQAVSSSTTRSYYCEYYFFFNILFICQTDSSKEGWLPRPAPKHKNEFVPNAWDIFESMYPDGGMNVISVLCVTFIYIYIGEALNAVQTPLTEHGLRQHWNCSVDYEHGHQEYTLPSPGLQFDLSVNEALAAVKNLRPQPFTGRRM